MKMTNCEMANGQGPMTNQTPMTNDQLGIGAWSLVIHWSLARGPWPFLLIATMVSPVIIGGMAKGQRPMTDQ
jgi:hypothetical protein